MNAPVRRYAVTLACALCLSACSGGGGGDTPANDDPSETGPSPTDTVDQGVFDGSRPSISTIYTDTQLAAIEDIGLTLHLGDSPPNIEGTYRMSPVVLSDTTVPGEGTDDIGRAFSSAFLTFSDQDNEALTLNLLRSADVGNEAEGAGSFISGSGNNFTVFFRTDVVEASGHIYEATETYSGTVTPIGIIDLEVAFFVIDDGGDPADDIIPVDTGRLLSDSDLVSEQTGAETGGETIDGAGGDVAGGAAALEPLLGELRLSAEIFEDAGILAAGGTYTYRASTDSDDIVDLEDDGNYSLFWWGTGFGQLSCVYEGGDTYDYFCNIDDSGDATAFVFNFTRPGVGEGLAFHCDQDVVDCDSLSVAELRVIAETSPNAFVELSIRPSAKSRLESVAIGREKL